jgi:aminomethyltransferase
MAGNVLQRIQPPDSLIAVNELRRTPLYEQHVAAGARLVPFAGWEMPVQYEGVSAEHLAVRSGCGVFDVSHMGEIETSGPGALGLLQRVLSNDVGKIDVGGAQYSVLCREDGGVLDDLFTYRLGDDRYLTVTNAANHERDLAWFREHAGEFDCEVADRLADWAMLAVQGPGAREIVAGLADGELPARMHTATVAVAGGECLVCGTGYTGEDGVEILCPPAHAEDLWTALLGAGATPAGLGARDTLRLEVCFHLYGNDLTEDRNPIEAGLGWCCKEETGFIGSDAVAAARAEGTAQRLAPFMLTQRGIPRQGNGVIGPDGAEAGVVTSGTHSPSLGQGIGMAYVDISLAESGTEVAIDVRGKRRPARIESKPLYEKD